MDGWRVWYTCLLVGGWMGFLGGKSEDRMRFPLLILPIFDADGHEKWKMSSSTKVYRLIKYILLYIEVKKS